MIEEDQKGVEGHGGQEDDEHEADEEKLKRAIGNEWQNDEEDSKGNTKEGLTGTDDEGGDAQGDEGDDTRRLTMGRQGELPHTAQAAAKHILAGHPAGVPVCVEKQCLGIGGHVKCTTAKMPCPGIEAQPSPREHPLFPLLQRIGHIFGSLGAPQPKVSIAALRPTRGDPPTHTKTTDARAKAFDAKSHSSQAIEHSLNASIKKKLMKMLKNKMRTKPAAAKQTTQQERPSMHPARGGRIAARTHFGPPPVLSQVQLTAHEHQALEHILEDIMMPAGVRSMAEALRVGAHPWRTFILRRPPLNSHDTVATLAPTNSHAAQKGVSGKDPMRKKYASGKQSMQATKKKELAVKQKTAAYLKKENAKTEALRQRIQKKMQEKNVHKAVLQQALSQAKKAPAKLQKHMGGKQSMQLAQKKEKTVPPHPEVSGIDIANMRIAKTDIAKEATKKKELAVKQKTAAYLKKENAKTEALRQRIQKKMQEKNVHKAVLQQALSQAKKAPAKLQKKAKKVLKKLPVVAAAKPYLGDKKATLKKQITEQKKTATHKEKEKSKTEAFKQGLTKKMRKEMRNSKVSAGSSAKVLKQKGH